MLLDQGVLYQVHIQDDVTDEWLLLFCIPVIPLTADPDIPENCDLYKLRGVFSIRVAARNQAGLGMPSELIVAVEGYLLLGHVQNKINVSVGMSELNCGKLQVLSEAHFSRTYCTYWEEFYYISDHGDSSKV